MQVLMFPHCENHSHHVHTIPYPKPVFLSHLVFACQHQNMD